MTVQQKRDALLAQIAAIDEKLAAKQAKEQAKKELSRWAVIDGTLKNVKTAWEEGETFMKWNPLTAEYETVGYLPTSFKAAFLPKPLYFTLIKMGYSKTSEGYSL